MQKHVSDDGKVGWLAIGLVPKYMNSVDSQLSKSPYPTFSQFFSALNDQELKLSSYEEDKRLVIILLM